MTHPGDIEVGFARRAEALHRDGDSEGAVRLLTAGARRFPGDVTALLVLAQVCRESGRGDEARAWLEAALRLDPACPAALAGLTVTDAPANTLRQARPDTRETPPPPPKNNSANNDEGADSHADDGSGSFRFEARVVPRKAASPVPSAFVFPVREEDEEPEIGENSAPHVATVTLAEIYLQQGLKEQAVQIYQQLLERQPEDDSVRRRLQEILRETEGP